MIPLASQSSQNSEHPVLRETLPLKKKCKSIEEEDSQSWPLDLP